MTGYERNQYSCGNSCLPGVTDAENLLSVLKPLLMLGILQDQRKFEFIILQSGSTGKGNNTPKLDLKVVLQSFCDPLENFCFSQAGIQDSPQDYSLHVAFRERELNLDRKNLSYISVLTCLFSECNFSPCIPMSHLFYSEYQMDLFSHGSLLPSSQSVSHGETFLGQLHTIEPRQTHETAWSFKDSFVKSTYILSPKPVMEGSLHHPNFAYASTLSFWSTYLKRILHQHTGENEVGILCQFKERKNFNKLYAMQSYLQKQFRVTLQLVKIASCPKAESHTKNKRTMLQIS